MKIQDETTMVSNGIEKVSLALVKAQHEIKPALKDATNPYYKSKYTTLLSVWEACKEPLHKNDLSVIQYGMATIEGWALVTRVLHSSGQYIEGTLPLICARDKDPQAMGSAISYTRRYGLAAMLGICGEDDDAQSAMPKETRPTEEKPIKNQIMENREAIKRWNEKTPEERKLVIQKPLAS